MHTHWLNHKGDHVSNPTRHSLIVPGSIHSLQSNVFPLKKNMDHSISSNYKSHIIVIITDLGGGDKSRDLQIKKPKGSISMTKMNHTPLRNQLKLNQQPKTLKSCWLLSITRSQKPTTAEGLELVVPLLNTG